MGHKGTRFFLIAFGVFIILAIVFLLIFNSRINSNVILGIEGTYEKGEVLEGVLEINLQEGELIPFSSKIIFVNNGSTYEYNLSEIITSELVEGNYFIEGSDVSGFGEGYGKVGAREVYPDVFFKFNVYSEERGSGGGSGGGSEEPSEVPVEEDKNKTKEDKDKEKNKTKEEEKDVSSLETIETTSGSTDEEVKEKDKIKDEESPDISITGQASLKFQKVVQGDVAYDREFFYSLDDGETIEIVNGSVKTETKDLSLEDLNVEPTSEGVIITTSYFEIEGGFGEEYIQRGRESLKINLSSLNLLFEEGDLEIYVLYEENEIISLETPLRDKVPFSQENIPETDERGNLSGNETYPPLFFTEFNIENLSLSEEEILILSENFPNQSVLRSAKEYRNWIIVEFSLGNYSAEYGYDSSLDQNVLEGLMENDRIWWLKDVSRKFSKEESFSNELLNFSKSYNLTQ